MKTWVAFLRRWTVLSVAVPALAGAVPAGVQYQGRLLDAAGQPTNGTVTMAVAIYTNATAGVALYSENIGLVTVLDGLYAFAFGNQAGFSDVLTNAACWLQVSVNGSALSPRQRLLAVPYAVRSAQVEQIGTNTTFLPGVVGSNALASGAVTADKLAASAQSGWTDDGTTVRLSSSADLVRVGVASGGAGQFYVQSAADNAVVGNAAQNCGVYGYATLNRGIYGYAVQNFGVYGYGVQNLGVYGNAAQNNGVYGYAGGNYGVYGFAGKDIGVYGWARNVGVYGFVDNAYGVYGYAGQNNGVYGSALQNFGVYGNAAQNFGVFGRAAANYGVYGTAVLHCAVAGVAGGQYGGWFSGANTGLYAEARTPGGVALLAAGLIRQNGTNVALEGHAHAAAAGWTDDGSTVRLTTTADAVRVGVSSGGAGKLYVEMAGANAVVGNAAGDYGVFGQAKNFGVYGLAQNRFGVYGDADLYGVFGRATTAWGVYGVSSNYAVYGNAVGQFGVYGQAPLFATCGLASNTAVYGEATYTGVRGYAHEDTGLLGQAENSYGVYGAAASYGVYGQANASYGVYGNAVNYGVYADAGTWGVYGRADNKFGVFGNANHNAVYGWANVANAVRGYSQGDYGVSGGADNYGVYGYAVQTYGGYFNSGDKTCTLGVEGNIRMIGSPDYGLLYANGSLKAFTIDHPLDPACRILRHFSYEGPEARVVYEGETVLDANGRSTVALPGYFRALARKPLVQLTPVGPHLVYVDREVEGNLFSIGGDAGTKVYWQVTAERDDPKARLERATRPVEQLKGTPGAPAQGRYVSPECYR